MQSDYKVGQKPPQDDYQKDTNNYTETTEPLLSIVEDAT